MRVAIMEWERTPALGIKVCLRDPQNGMIEPA
jgi:hypothetical protein